MTSDDKVDMPTTPEMVEDDMSVEDGDASPSLSWGQIEGSTDTHLKRYVPQPPTLTYAKVQGLAKLSEILHDPDGEIAENIRKTQGFKQRPAANGKCKKVRDFLTKPETVTDESVRFILAIWCMLGGHIPSMWRDRCEGAKAGHKGSLTAWGKKMIDELEHLGGSNDAYAFELCLPYETGKLGKTHFNYTKFAKILEKLDYDAANTKRKRPAPKPMSLGKHVASSPRQSHAAKRRNTMAFEGFQQIGGSFAGNEDEDDDEGSQGDVESDVMGGGKKKYVPASETRSTKHDSNRGGLSRPEMPTDSYRDQDDALPLLQKRRAPPSPYRNQGLEDTYRNYTVPRRYGPGLKTSNASSNKTFMGLKSQRRKEGYSVEMPTASGLPADVLASSQRHSRAQYSQPRFGVPALLQQGPTALPGQTPFEASASVQRGSAVPHGQFHFTPEHPLEIDNSDIMKGLPSGKIDDRHLSRSSQQDSMPGRRQDTPRIASTVDRGSDGRGEEYVTGNECLSLLPGSATANRKGPDRLHDAVSNRDKSEVRSTGVHPGGLGQDSLDPMAFPTHFSTLTDKPEDATNLAKLLRKAPIRHTEQNIKDKVEITRLNTELSDLRQKAKLDAAKIAALEADVASMTGLLKGTPAATILQWAMGTNKVPAKTSLADSLLEMGGSDDMGNSGSKLSEDHHG